MSTVTDDKETIFTRLMWDLNYPLIKRVYDMSDIDINYKSTRNETALIRAVECKYKAPKHTTSH